MVYIYLGNEWKVVTVSEASVPLLVVSSVPATPSNSSVHLYPRPERLGTAAAEMLRPDTSSVLVLYEDWQDILGLETLLSTMQPSQEFLMKPSYSVLFHNLTHVPIWKPGPQLDIIVSKCTKLTGLRYLEALLLKGFLSPGNRIILPCLDLNLEDISRYSTVGAELILLNLVTDPETWLVSMLVEDGLDILANSLASLQMADQLPAVRPLDCTNLEAWSGGSLVLKKMTGTTFLGVSGQVSLDDSGRRSIFTLHVSEIQYGSRHSMGIWTQSNGYLRSQEKNILSLIEGEGNTWDTVAVTSILSAPYTMKSSTEGEYEGFAIDLMREISRLVGFNFTISIASGYGSIDADGNWNGMIAEILEGRADLAVGDITISYQREEVVDFSMPFLDLGISILFVSSPAKSINLFSFMTPLSAEVWILMLVGGISVSLALYFISRVSPFETLELDCSDGESPFLSLRHCLWFSIASWVQQGCDFLPRALSTRTLASFWWFFTLIMISSYTANLAAFLTIERMDSPISSVQDLAKSSIKYGSIRTGSTMSFFKDATSPLYKKMQKKMEGWEDSLVDSNQAGIDKVLMEKGGYAFFMESVSVEYQVERNCQLAQVGANLDSKSYGVAMKKGSLLRSQISSAIIRLRQDGVLDRLKQKWWKEERGGGACEEEAEGDNAGGVSKLTVENLGGIFLVLLLGLILAVALALVEVLWVHLKKSNIMI